MRGEARHASEGGSGGDRERGEGKSRRLDHRCSAYLLIPSKTIPDKRKLNESVLEGAEEREGESAPFSNTIFVPKVRNSLLAVDSRKNPTLFSLNLHY